MYKCLISKGPHGLFQIWLYFLKSPSVSIEGLFLRQSRMALFIVVASIAGKVDYILVFEHENLFLWWSLALVNLCGCIKYATCILCKGFMKVTYYHLSSSSNFFKDAFYDLCHWWQKRFHTKQFILRNCYCMSFLTVGVPKSCTMETFHLTLSEERVSFWSMTLDRSTWTLQIMWPVVRYLYCKLFSFPFFFLHVLMSTFISLFIYGVLILFIL